MRTRTTYVAVLLALTAGSALTIVSCTPDTTSPSSVVAASDPPIVRAKVDDLRQKYSWIGKYHTDGLEYIYKELSKKDGKAPTRAELCRRAVKALKEFHKTTRGTDVPSSFMEESFRKESCVTDSEITSVRTSMLAYIPSMTAKYELSAAAVGYIDRLAAVANSAGSLPEFVSQTNAIEAQAAASLPANEAAAVAGVASIARSSASYWEQNLTSWMSLPGALPMPYSQNVGDFNGRTLQNQWPGWWDNPAVKGFRRVLGADIISGGRTAYLAWAVGPIGLEAVAASALFASATTGIALLLF
ncbi:MAG: hypothetical protein ABI556_06760 [Gemmatimonadales bacterium]